MWELRTPLFPASRWLLELGAQEDEEPGGVLRASPQCTSGKLGQRWREAPVVVLGYPTHCITAVGRRVALEVRVAPCSPLQLGSGEGSVNLKRGI